MVLFTSNYSTDYNEIVEKCDLMGFDDYLMMI